MDAQKLIDQGMNLIIEHGPGFLMAILTLLIGLWIINFIVRIVGKSLTHAKVDESLSRFLKSLIGVILKILLFVSVASMVGIETTSFVAILGAAGLAVGLALQGSLANFAGGILLLLFKPYKVGDFIDAQGEKGTVKEIQVFNTVLKTPDNKIIIIPNGSISNGIITNFSAEATRRVDMTFGIGYDDDIQKAKQVLQSLVDADERILKDPASQIVLTELGDSSVNFAVRVWANAADYWGIFFDMQEKVKETFDKENISIPFPQRDVHIYNEK